MKSSSRSSIFAQGLSPAQGNPVEDLDAVVDSAYICDGQLIATTTVSPSLVPVVPVATGSYWWLIILVVLLLISSFATCCCCCRKKSMCSRRLSYRVQYNRANGSQSRSQSRSQSSSHFNLVQTGSPAHLPFARPFHHFLLKFYSNRVVQRLQRVYNEIVGTVRFIFSSRTIFRIVPFPQKLIFI